MRFIVTSSFCLGGAHGDVEVGDVVDLPAAQAAQYVRQGRLRPALSDGITNDSAAFPTGAPATTVNRDPKPAGRRIARKE